MKILSSGPNGNALFVMAKVRECLVGADRAAEWPAVSERMRSGGYANLCAVAKEVTYGSVEVVDDEEEADV